MTYVENTTKRIRVKFTIKFTPQALDHLRTYRKLKQKTIVEATKKELLHDPLTPTKNRKPLRENPLSRWELRVGKYRVFYDANSTSQVVEIKTIGHKEHNQLFLGGKEFKL